MPFAFIALALAASGPPPAPAAPAPPAAPPRAGHAKAVQPAKPFRGWRRLGRWTLYVSGDPFAQETTCRVTAPNMEYGRGVLTIRFGGDTLDAIYRIDGGPPIKASSDALAIARRGLPVYQDDLASPSGGVVRVPIERLAGAQEVRVQLKRSGRVTLWRLAGLEPALVVARQYRCEDLEPGKPEPD